MGPLGVMGSSFFFSEDIFFGGLSGSFFDFGVVIWGPLGHHFGSFWGSFWRPWGVIGRLFGCFFEGGEKRGLEKLWPFTFRGQSGPKGAKMGPKLEPKPLKIDQKIDRNFDGCFCGPLGRFFTHFEGKIEPTWDKSGCPNGSEREKASIA